MLKSKYKLFFFAPLVFLFIWIIIPLANLIKTTLTFDLRNQYNSQNNYTYEIHSTDNEIIDKLSKKFDVFDSKEEIPYFIKFAFISSEDKRFYSHNGIDLFGLMRAFIINVRSGYIKEGGSTITQQVARTIFLNNELSFKRKFHEIIISLILDLKYSKQEILKIYLNNIYLGSGAYGINEAAQIYFGKLINELTLSEIALLAGLAPAPSIFSPFENYELAIEKRNHILISMHEEEIISLDELSKALSEEINLINMIGRLNDNLLINFILAEANEIDLNNLFLNNERHLIIKTSINKKWQLKGQKISGFLNSSDTDIGLISIESDTGLIRVMVTGKRSEINQFNRVTDAIRPLGSIFKIIPYIAALKDGKTIHYIFNDEPTCWNNYCPNNFQEIYRGEISMLDAFKFSSNIVPIKIAEEIGLKEIIELANSFGLGYEQKLQEFYPLAIGAYGDSLLNITNVYSTINNKGYFLNPSIIERIEFKNGDLVWENKFNSKRIIDSKIAIAINKMLEKSVSEGSGIAAYIYGEKIFGKTGTSDNNRDLWFIGSIETITTGIWLGQDDNESSEFSSGDAAFIWKMFINQIKNEL